MYTASLKLREGGERDEINGKDHNNHMNTTLYIH
jgi:hypothetical protein